MSRRGRKSRLAMTALVSGLIAYYFGLGPTLAWVGVNAVLEGWLLLLTAQFRPGERCFNVVQRLGPAAAFSTSWSVMASLSWIHGPPGMKFAALVTLFGLLIEGLKYAALSRPMLFSMAPPAFIGLAVAGLSAHDLKPGEFLVVGVTLVGLFTFLLEAVRLLRTNAEALERAQTEALEASRAKSAFVAMMSHELRTPMNGVLGLAHALNETRLDATQADYVGMIVQSGDGLMAILNDILDLSKVEAGKLELEAAPFDIRQLAEQARLVWSHTAQLKGLGLTLTVDPAIPDWLCGDPLRVRQILLNLVSNALKFTSHGEVRILIAATPDGVSLSVSDTGPGLTDEQRLRLFQPFSQGDRSTARRFGGTGLGLSITRHLAQLMGGDIEVVSVLGQGATFTASLVLPKAAAPIAPAESAPEQIGSIAGLRVLVVDDTRVNQVVARAILEAADAIVDTVDGGREALARLQRETYDVVLMDVHMPEMDGIEAVRRIRTGEGGDRNVPIVALTADAMNGAAEQLRSQGFDLVQPKPVQPAQLLGVLAGLRRSGLVLPAA